MSAEKITKTITLPDGDVIVFRKLSGKHLRRAAEAKVFDQAERFEKFAELQVRMKKARATISGLMGADAPKPEPEPEPAPAPAPVVDAPEVEADPMDSYDPYALIARAIKSVNGDALSDDDAKVAYADDLSEEDVEVASKAVLQLAAPKLFWSKAEKDAEQKNA